MRAAALSFPPKTRVVRDRTEAGFDLRCGDRDAGEPSET
jgi:hypothetical protein